MTTTPLLPNFLLTLIHFNFFQELWRIFDYNIWIEYTTGTTPTSVLCRFLTTFFSQGDSKATEYLEVFLENEEKLKLEIEHHENIQCTSLVDEFYRICVQRQLFDEKLIQNFVLHLLSYGAVIYITDIDKLNFLSLDKDSNFFEELLFMDLHEDPSKAVEVTFMYFKYTLRPDVDDFLKKLLASFLIQRDNIYTIMNVRHAIRKLSKLFAFKYHVKIYYENLFAHDETIMSSLKYAKCFPSLLQLSRDVSRIALCDHYGIQTIKQFHYILNSLNISNVIKQLLTYRQKIYRVS